MINYSSEKVKNIRAIHRTGINIEGNNIRFFYLSRTHPIFFQDYINNILKNVKELETKIKKLKSIVYI